MTHSDLDSPMEPPASGWDHLHTEGQLGAPGRTYVSALTREKISSVWAEPMGWLSLVAKNRCLWMGTTEPSFPNALQTLTPVSGLALSSTPSNPNMLH